MPITNGYCTLSEIKAYLSISDSTDDTLLENAVNTTSRAIDRYCGRRFYAASETRYFTTRNPTLLLTGEDFLSVSAVLTDEDGDGTHEITIPGADYVLWPTGATAAPIPSPYAGIRLLNTSSYAFPVGVADGVKVTGSFGYCASGSHPDSVKQACLIQASRLFKRKDTVFGVQFNQDFGAVTIARKGLDPDASLLLDGGGLVRLTA